VSWVSIHECTLRGTWPVVLDRRDGFSPSSRGRFGWWVKGLVGRLHPAVWFLLRVARHHPLGALRAIAAGFALSGVAMLTWWIAYGRT
jgi:hypothetical protein